MKNSIIDNSQKNNNIICDKIKISSNHKQAALVAKEKLEDSYASKIDKSTNGKRNDFLKDVRKNKLEVSIEKKGMEYHKMLIFNKIKKYNELSRKDEAIVSLKKKYGSSQELLNWIKIYSAEISM